MNWNYRHDDFDLKLDANGKPDIHKQSESSARLWYHTIQSRFGESSPFFNKFSDERLKEQQQILIRAICCMSCSVPMIGEQNKWNYTKDETHTISSLISSGGRFGYIFEEKDLGRKFVNFLITGNENSKFEDFVTLTLDSSGRKKQISNVHQNEPFAELYKRISTHDQKIVNGHFYEVKYYTKGTPECFGMDFPIGGTGNNIKKNNTELIIGYNGYSTDRKYQLGSMLFKYDENKNNARFFYGFESTAPYQKNHFHHSHGFFSTINKTFRKWAFNLSKKIVHNNTYNTILVKNPSLTGQSKGSETGIFPSYGSNVAFIDNDKFLKSKNMYLSLMNMDENNRKSFVQQILMSKSSLQREIILTTIVATQNTSQNFTKQNSCKKELDLLK